MNLTHLKQVLDERSDGSAERVLHNMRLHGVRAKVVARRRRRIAAWTACGAVMLAGLAATVVLGPRPDGPPTAAASPAPTRMIEGFPEYSNGARVVAAKSESVSAGRIALTITPTTTELVFFRRCDTAPRATVYQKMTVNGREFSWGTCEGTLTTTRWGPDFDVAVGRPATFALILTETEGPSRADAPRAPLPTTGTFGFAIGAKLPFEEYPPPPRPSGALEPLGDDLLGACATQECRDRFVFESDPADHNRVVRRTVTWRRMESIDMVAQTPGLLHLYVNGKKIDTAEWWNYGNGQSGMAVDNDALKLSPGEQVTVEIRPQYMTGAWRVALR